MTKTIVLSKMPADYRYATEDENRFFEAGGNLFDHIFVLDDEGFDYLSVPQALPVDMFPDEDWNYPPSQSGAEFMASYYNSDSYIAYLNG